MTLIDTSAWVEFLRDTGSPACLRVDELLADDFSVCEPVRMEVLAGARDEQHLRDLRRLLARGQLIATVSADFEEAAMLYRACRRRGTTVRRMLDCLIGAIAIRVGRPLLHCDGDFEMLARHSLLRLDDGDA